MVSINSDSSDDIVWIKLGVRENGEPAIIKVEQKYIDMLHEKKPSDQPIEQAIERCLLEGVQAHRRGDPEMLQLLVDAGENSNPPRRGPSARERKKN